MKFNALIALVFLLSFQSYSQVAITGTVTDKEGNGLPECNVRLMTKSNTLVRGTVADFDGQYTITAAPDSNFVLIFSYVGYASFSKEIKTGRESINLGTFKLGEDSKTLKEVEVKTTQTRGTQKSDTTDFNAAAFKTNPDATAEDLVKKMPGITSDNNGIKVNGETVQKVLVDGKAFFGDDASAALKNLPADLIERVQVFDKMSDQAAFTGFNDGEQQKTINLVTKREKIVGNFGRIYGGAGADEALQGRYNAGAAINNFNDKRRLTLLLLGNNVNQQNFTTADLSGAMSSSSQRGGQGGGRQGGSGNSSFLSPNQNGITTTRSAGLNYSDEWGKKVQVSGSYFFNNTDNVSSSSISRNYFTENKLVYQQQNQDRMTNNNHRLNFRFEYTIDSSNKLILTPAITFQNNDARSILSGKNLVNDGTELSNTGANSRSLNNASDISNMVLFQHKMNKPGRTVSLRVNTNLNNRQNEGSYYSANRYSDTTENILDQEYETDSYTKKLSGSLAYTEPLSKSSQLQLSYSPSYSESRSDKQTLDMDPASGIHSDFNPALSNKYNNIYQTQKGGLTYRYRKESLQFSFGADAQQSNLNGVQEFPNNFQLNQSFNNFLPNAMLNYKFSKSNNLRIWYRSSTDIPSVTQLQNVVDISNPLQVKMGNPALKQTFDNNLNFRLGGFNTKTSRNVMLFMNGSYSDNYISNATYILKSDTNVAGYELKSGSQLSKPVNLNNFYSGRAFFVYGFPVSLFKSNLNLNGGINYNHTPGLFNNVLNYSNSYAVNGGIFAGSNISEKIDFSIGYNANYTIVKNTVQKQSDNNFFSHSTTFKLNWILPSGFVFNTDISHTLYNGLSKNFNQEYTLWNAYVGYKFLKDKSLEAKVSVFDILNQNRSIGRTVTGAYTEDNYTSVLRRYGMFTLTYTIKKFKSGAEPKPAENPFPGPGSPDGGRQRH